MKMLVAIMKNDDAECVTDELSDFDICVTRIASTGGFLRQGQSTLMIGVENEQVEMVIRTIKNNCAPTVDPIFTRARIFIINVEHFEQR